MVIMFDGLNKFISFICSRSSQKQDKTPEIEKTITNLENSINHRFYRTSSILEAIEAAGKAIQRASPQEVANSLTEERIQDITAKLKNIDNPPSYNICSTISNI